MAARRVRMGWLGEVGGAHTQTGGVCWPMAALRSTYEPEPENIPGSIEFCAHDPAEAPNEKRLAKGSACRRGCDCLSALCDRGTCADSADLGAWNYGKYPSHFRLRPEAPPQSSKRAFLHAVASACPRSQLERHRSR